MTRYTNILHFMLAYAVEFELHRSVRRIKRGHYIAFKDAKGNEHEIHRSHLGRKGVDGTLKDIVDICEHRSTRDARSVFDYQTSHRKAYEFKPPAVDFIVDGEMYRVIPINTNVFKGQRFVYCRVSDYDFLNRLTRLNSDRQKQGHGIVIQNFVNRNAIIDEIKAERKRQIEKHGSNADLSIFEQIAILTEEVGEVSKAALESKHEGKPSSDIRKELIQVAATALQLVENFDENESKSKVCVDMQKLNEELNKGKIVVIGCNPSVSAAHWIHEFGKFI